MEGAQSSRCIIKDMCAQLRASWCRGINNFMGHKTQADQVDSSLMYDYDISGNRPASGDKYTTYRNTWQKSRVWYDIR